MPTLFINDKEITFAEGENILPAVLRNKIEIPHYCYHPGLSITAQCRQCLVEITDLGDGHPSPKLQASCAMPAAPGMRVLTESPKAIAGQKLVNEYILMNHPLDCSICDQAGECDLQDFAFRYGSGNSEMEYEKRTYGRREIGTFLELERNRCIHCSLCERFSKEITGSHDFSMFFRSHELTFDTFSDQKITHKFQGNLADICPVGCIMEKDWRFKKRAWKLKNTPSVCNGCSTGCNINLDHHDNHIYRIKPRENHEVNRWWMCDEGRLSHHQLPNSRNRLTTPLAMVAGKQQPAELSALITALLERIKELQPPPTEILAISDSAATNEELFMLRTLMQQGFNQSVVFFPFCPGKTAIAPPKNHPDPFIYTLLTTDKSPNTTGASLLGLVPDPNGNKILDAAKKASVIWILGSPFLQHQVLHDTLAQAKLRIHLGHTENVWSKTADVVFPIYTHAEKYGTYINKLGRIQRIQPAIKPPENCSDAIFVLSSLLQQLKNSPPLADGKEVLAALSRLKGPWNGLSWDHIGPQGKPFDLSSLKNIQ